MEHMKRRRLLVAAVASIALTSLLSVLILTNTAGGQQELLQQQSSEGVIPFGFGAVKKAEQQQKLEEVDPEGEDEEEEGDEPWEEDDEPKGSFDPDADEEDFDEPLDEENEEEGEVDPEEEELDDEEEPEMVEEHEHNHIVHRLHHYQLFHPVFTRCMKQVNMFEFSHTIRKTCGNIHELDSCSYPCAQAMQQFSEESGCCFETVMNAYAHLDPYAHHAWRHWQGTLSGKCGVTFEDENCGESVGEKKFQDLKDKVEDSAMMAAQNQDMLTNLIYPPYYGYGDGYYDQKEPMRATLEESHHQKQPSTELSADGAENLKEREPLGDEVIDLPVTPSEDIGDIHVPGEKLQPYMFAHKPAVGEPMKDEGDHNAGTATQGNFHVNKVVQGTQLYDAYDDYKNYQNQLRLREAYENAPETKKDDKFFNWPGESWHKSPVQSLHAAEEAEEGFPMAYGILENGVAGPRYGYGIPHEAAEDPYTKQPLLEADPEDQSMNRLTPAAAVRAAEGERTGQTLERGHMVDGMTDVEKYDASERTPKDQGTRALEHAGVRV